MSFFWQVGKVSWESRWKWLLSGAGRTINQRWSRGGAGALTEAFQYPSPSHTLPCPLFFCVLFLSKVWETCISFASVSLMSWRLALPPQQTWWMPVTEGWLVAMLHLNQTLIPLRLVFTPTRLVSSDWWTWLWQGLVHLKANLDKDSVL